MNCGDDDLSPPYISSYLLPNNPYGSSLASSASSSSASVWSDAASQSSDDSSVTSASASDADISDTYYCPSQSSEYEQTASIAVCWPKSISKSVAPEQRQHPRRTSNCNGSLGRSVCPPALIRQSERKVSFVDSLVDSSAQIVEAIWPLSSIPCRTDVGSKGVLPLRTFIQETLRRSRTSYSTLQVALYYLVLIKPHIPKHDFTMEQTEDTHSFRALQCGRRMFLSALILASKYLQDRNYSARAWSKISGLNVHEINQNEIAFLLAVNWRLHITDEVFQRWAGIVLKYTPSSPPSPGSVFSLQHEKQSAEWKSIILGLNAELDNINDITPSLSKQAPVCNIGRTSKPAFERSCGFVSGSNESTPTPSYLTPKVMEPSPLATYSPNKAAPAFGLLPTPRLTPQSTGYRTPAAGTSSYTKPSMAFAMSQACPNQLTERWVTSSPQSYTSQRRSSLANSHSSMSSPESMVSDTSSRSSRSSSISSATSVMCAPSSKLDVKARCRSAQQYSEMYLKPMIAAVPEHCFENGPTSSPESYFRPAGKELLGLSESLTLQTPLARYAYSNTSVEADAARALQDLQQDCPRATLMSATSPSKRAKRSRPQSIDMTTVLQENVRSLLHDGAGLSSHACHTLASGATANPTHRSVDGRKRHRTLAASGSLIATLAHPTAEKWDAYFG